MISLKAFIDSVHDSVVAANDTLTDSSFGILAKFFEKGDPDDGVLRPRTRKVNYPQITDSEVTDIEVEVPIITLAPITCPTIDSVDFYTKFEIDFVDKELQLIFSQNEKDNNRSGNIHIKISPQDMPEGLKTIIDGYERVLKIQIP